MTIHPKTHAACLQYADANRSDPFAYARAISHARTGVGYLPIDGRADAIQIPSLFAYSADEHWVERTIEQNGQSLSFQVKEYRNQSGPELQPGRITVLPNGSLPFRFDQP